MSKTTTLLSLSATKSLKGFSAGTKRFQDILSV